MNDSVVANSIPLSKSPLGVIALFIILVYGFASLVVGASAQLSQEERIILIYFMVIFPVLVLMVFTWLVSEHHYKLYRPDDFKETGGFIEAYREGRKDISTLPNLDREIEKQINKVINPKELEMKLSKLTNTELAIRNLASELKESIRTSSFVRVDLSYFLSIDSVFELPVAAFPIMRDFLDEVYYLMEGVVNPFEYGYTWVLQDVKTLSIVESMGMRHGIKRGLPFKDERSLELAGISVGHTYKAIIPKISTNPSFKRDA